MQAFKLLMTTENVAEVTCSFVWLCFLELR